VSFAQSFARRKSLSHHLTNGPVVMRPVVNNNPSMFGLVQSPILITSETETSLLLDCLDRWASEIPIDDPIIVRVTCEKVYLENIWIPDLTALCSCPVPTQEEELEDWQNDISVLFEWVGMAGLNAQRCG